MMEISSDSPVKSSKRLTSVVWNHFERVKMADICYALCLHCNKRLSGSSNSGTTHLRNHLVRCLKKANDDVTQILASKRKRKESALSRTNVINDEGQMKNDAITPVGFKFDQEPKKYKFDQELKKEESIINVASVKFDQEQSRLDLARMIMLHGYPLTMVDHVGFKLFVKNLQPLFEVMTNDAIELDCMKIYEKEKQKVYETIHNLHGRISLALEMWTSSDDDMEYLGLIANYIDEEWKLQKKIVNFVTLDSSHTDDKFSDVIIKCLMDWEIERKLFAMTFDDCSTYDGIVFRIKEWLSQNKPLLKDGKLFDMRCATHVVKSIVQDALEAVRELTHKIRESVRYVKSSQETQGKFLELAQQVGIDSQKRLVLDSPTRWNSTYLMLETAIEYKGCFSLLQEQDGDYTTALSEIEWDQARSVSSYVKYCVELIEIFSGNKCATANVYFPDICDLHLHLIEWCKSEDYFLCSTGQKMKARFNKYWSKCGLALAIAVILDPQFKMKLVEYYYSQIYGSDAPTHIKNVSDVIKDLFSEYSMCSNSLDQDSSKPGGGLSSSNNGTRDRLRGFDKFLHESTKNKSVTSDLDKYLEEPVFPRSNDFNILNWWKVQMPRFPILSMMARDILGISVSTLMPELAFSNGGRIFYNHRGTPNPDTRQALICGQDWLQMDFEESNPSSSLAAIPLLMEPN